MLFGPSGKGRNWQKKGDFGRFRSMSRKGGQTPLKPPFVTPPFAAARSIYPYPLGAGSARPNRKMGAPDPENPLSLGFSVLGGGSRPWSQAMVSEGARPWGRGRSGDFQFLTRVTGKHGKVHAFFEIVRANAAFLCGISGFWVLLFWPLTG